MRKPTPIFAFLIIGITISSYILAIHGARADTTDSTTATSTDSSSPPPHENFYTIATDLASRATLSLSATVQNGTLSWGYTTIASSTPTLIRPYLVARSFFVSDPIPSSPGLTLDVYRGIMGSSTLVYSEPLSPTTTSGSFPFIPDTKGEAPFNSYFMTVAAPTGGNSLSDFRAALTDGYVNTEQLGIPLGNYIPATYGILSLAIPDVPQKPPVSNVLFIPGTLTSRLYMKNAVGIEQELWEPQSDLDVGSLAMKSDGTSINTIYTRDLVGQLYSNDPIYGSAAQKALGSGVNIYGPFMSFMDGLVTNGTVKEWRSFPYDWRYDISDIVKNGTLVGTATSAPRRIYLQDVVQELASTSPTGRVTIIAHSNGGLIAKALASDLESRGEGALIDHIIMVGTPQLGTPKALLDMLHGSEFTELGGLIMYSGSVRAADETMPGPYDLLPSPAYFARIKDPVASFDDKQPAAQYRKAIGVVVDTFLKLAEFTEDTFHLDSSAGMAGSIRTPIPLSSALVQKAEATHASIDSWVPPSNLSLTAIAGWGQLTPFQMAYSGTTGLNCDRTSFFVTLACSLQPQLQNTVLSTENGDDTVVAASAINTATDTLYFDAMQYAKQTGTRVVHQNLLNASPVQSELSDLLQDKSVQETYVSTTMPSENRDPLTVVSAHSPVNLLATDAHGNQTGIVTIPGLTGLNFEKEDIPGSSIQVVDDEKYVYLPESSNYTISLQGYDTGATTINVGTVDVNGVATTTATYADIPTTASTTASFVVGANASAPASITLNVDGFSTTTVTKEASTTQNTDPSYRVSRFMLRYLMWSQALPKAIRSLISGNARLLKDHLITPAAFQAFMSLHTGVKLPSRDPSWIADLIKSVGL
ncbi:MAG: hypothetical protein P4M11_06145 [Candidatus Pacebacteria bacterium]|nr:hypothetical protein [Candidatus Paceibacterota bacterium]